LFETTRIRPKKIFRHYRITATQPSQKQLIRRKNIKICTLTPEEIQALK